jgi:hypothetical protein
MSITTYAELVTALDGNDGYLHRTDLTAKIPDFVKLCESRLNRKLRLMEQELETTLTATVGSRTGATMATPTRFGTPIALWCTTYLPRQELQYVNPEQLPVTTSNSASNFYTVDGSYIATENPADRAYTYTLRYLATLNLQTTLTNDVLDRYPDLYLYGTLLASTPYTQDATQVEMWGSLFNLALREANSDTVATKSKAMLRTEFGGQRSNIFQG